ncbi:MAG: Ni/Fe hydrogenase subunit alpha [Coriobacteriia bacterium]|nr:Ni/Fe hydrogenase subunit alpha [Coriobacteriia bacterium]
MKKIDIHHIARIEGHGNVEVRLNKGKIEHIELRAVEPARFFEAFVGGRHFNDVALIVSRICGICSPNHTISGLMAVEDALNIEVSERTRLMRQLLVQGSFIQNHATHLYFLAAPDYISEPSVLPLSNRDPQTLQRALDLKKLGNDLCAAVGGRPVHPINAVVGGFTDQPDQMALQVLAARLRAALKEAVQTVEFFAKVEFPDFHPQREKLALYKPGGFAFLSDRPSVRVQTLYADWNRPVGSYHDFIREHFDLSTATPAGNAKFSLLKNQQKEEIPFMVGALARVNINWDNLMPAATGAAEAAFKSTGIQRGADNPYLNNLCQAIEIVDVLQRCAALCEKLASDFEKCQGQIEPPKSIDPQAGIGYSASEAPRGTLYYSIGLDEEGYVTSGDVITPTAQNLACIEADLRQLAPQLEGLPEEDMILRIEQLIRAYDPCLSCAVH